MPLEVVCGCVPLDVPGSSVRVEAGDRKAQGSLVAPSRCCEVGGRHRVVVTDRSLPAGKIQAVLRPLKLFSSRDSVAHSPFGSRRPARPRVDRVRTPRSSAGRAALALGLPGSPRLSARPPRPPARSVRAARVVTLRPGPLALPLRALLGRT